MLTILRCDLMQHHAISSILRPHGHHQPPTLLRTGPTIDKSCSKHEVILGWHLMHHYGVVCHALWLWAGWSRDLLTEMLAIELWVAWHTRCSFEPPAPILSTTSIIIPIHTSIMCIARIIVAKPIASILHILVIVMWPRCTHGCAALVERDGSERWN